MSSWLLGHSFPLLLANVYGERRGWKRGLCYPHPSTGWWTLAIYYKNVLLSEMSPKGVGDRTASLSFDPSPISMLSAADIHQSLGVCHMVKGSPNS